MPSFCEEKCGNTVSKKGMRCQPCALRISGSAKGTAAYKAAKDPQGKGAAADVISQAKSNPKSNLKMQKRRREEAVPRIQAMSENEDVLTLAEARDLACQIMLGVSPFDGNGLTLESYLGLDTASIAPLSGWGVYFGYTARLLEEEALRWLTTRGASWQDADGNFIDPSKRNRPVLLWPDSTTITMQQAEEELGFQYVEVYASTLKINARAVEDALQVRYQHLPLGQRLWRCADKGSKYDKEIDGKLHRVFITCSPKLGQMFAEQKIMINV